MLFGRVAGILASRVCTSMRAGGDNSVGDSVGTRDGSSGRSEVAFRDLFRVDGTPFLLDSLQDWLTVHVDGTNVWSW